MDGERADELASPELREGIAGWHRALSVVTDWLILSGDLSPESSEAVAQLDEWQAAGVTDIIDVRAEWSDLDLVQQVAPGLRYWYLGTHDDGGRQDDSWFEEGLAAARAALEQPGAVLLVHCHMGINRGPSMGFRILLDQGWDPIDALAAIRSARPIAAIAYAPDAIDHHRRSLQLPQSEVSEGRAEVERWLVTNGIDVSTIIRRIRRTDG